MRLRAAKSVISNSFVQCVERVVPVVSMLNQLPSSYREKTQLALLADDTAELLTIINKVDQRKEGKQTAVTITVDSLQKQTFESVVTTANSYSGNSYMTTALPKILIVDAAGYYRGYFTGPFDENKLLLTYSSVLEHH